MTSGKMTHHEANQIVKKEIGSNYRVWRRNGLFYLGYEVQYSGKKILLNKYVSSSGYEELLAKTGVLSLWHPGRTA